MGRASTTTILPLDTYAEIMGINPLQFNSGDYPTSFPNTGRTERWIQHDWQDNSIASRESLANEIRRAEEEIRSLLGAWPGPKWTVNEVQDYPHYLRRGRVPISFMTPFGHHKQFRLDNSQFIEAGNRTKTLIEAGVAIVYSEPNSEGFNALATITVTTTVTDACEIALFYNGKSGGDEWEIRSLKSVTISGGSAVITVDAWKLFEPDKLEAFPGTTGFTALDPSDADNMVDTIDVYRIYNDPTSSATLVWEASPSLPCSCGTSGTCAYCALTTQTACTIVRDANQGFVAVTPATYADGAWTAAVAAVGREPDRVIVDYKSGYQDESACGAMPRDLAIAVSYLATARLARPICSGNETLMEREKWLRRDYLLSRPDGDIIFPAEIIRESQFGTRGGEIEAYKIIKRRMAAVESRVEFAIL